MNNAKVEDTNLIVILNDNQMSISPSVGNLSLYLNRIRSNSLYNASKKGVRNFLNHIPLIGKKITYFIEWLKNGIRHLFLPNSVLFEQFGFTYLGPIDGHDTNDLIRILNRAKIVKKPVLIHVITQKGKGYKPAEDKPDVFHGIGKFDVESGKILKSSSKKGESYSERFGDELVKLAEKNDKIVAITAAMPKGTGLAKFAEKFPKRFFDVGIAEGHATTFATGLAVQGLVPVFAVYSTFLQRAYDEIVHDVALQNAHVIFAIDRAGIVGNDGETHQGIYDLSFLSHIPNLTIMAPKDGDELAKMLKYAIFEVKGPVAIRYPRGGYVKSVCSEFSLDVKNNNEFLNRSEVLIKGKDLTIIGYGKMVKTAIQVAQLLKKQRIEAEVINLRFLKPIDKDTILKSIQKTKSFVTIEDNVVTGGVGSAVLELTKDMVIKNKLIFGYPDEFVKHGNTEELEDIYGMSAEKIFEKIINERKEKDFKR